MALRELKSQAPSRDVGRRSASDLEEGQRMFTAALSSTNGSAFKNDRDLGTRAKRRPQTRRTRVVPASTGADRHAELSASLPHMLLAAPGQAEGADEQTGAPRINATTVSGRACRHFHPPQRRGHKEDPDSRRGPRIVVLLCYGISSRTKTLDGSPPAGIDQNGKKLVPSVPRPS